MHTQAPPATVVLNEYIRKMYPKALEKRRNEQLQREESTADTPRTNDGPRTVGLFVMETVLPGQSLQLHIFEPRYRLLVRRALERDNKIGLAAASSHNGVYTYFCEANIVNSQMIPDGRYLIHLVGERPMRILSSSTDEAGYKVAEAELVEDGDEYDDVEEVAASLQSQLAEAHAAERQAVAREAHVKRSREKDAFKFCSNFIQRWLSDKDLVQELSDELESVGARAEKAAALAERAAEESLVDADVARGGSGVLGVSA